MSKAINKELYEKCLKIFSDVVNGKINIKDLFEKHDGILLEDLRNYGTIS